MHKRTILAVGLLLVGLLVSAASVSAENRSITDIANDVVSVDFTTSNSTIITSSPELPIEDIDIIGVTCNDNGAGTVTMGLTVAGQINDRGNINDLLMTEEPSDPNNLSYNTIGYTLNMSTNESDYMIYYVNGSCKLTIDDNIDNLTTVPFTKTGNTLTLTFSLQSSLEEIEGFGAMTTFIKANISDAMTAEDYTDLILYYQDSAPNEPLTILEAGTDQTLAAPGTPVKFTCIVVATTGEAPYTYHWVFGDGQVADEQNPTHTYTKTGEFTYNCTVTDHHGTQVSEEGTIKIQGGSNGNIIGSGNMVLIFIAIIVIIAVAGIAIVVYLIRR